jgi:hypothetical protein
MVVPAVGNLTDGWSRAEDAPIVRSMSGGLEEPEQFEQEQGSLALLVVDDAHGRHPTW